MGWLEENSISWNYWSARCKTRCLDLDKRRANNCEVYPDDCNPTPSFFFGKDLTPILMWCQHDKNKTKVMPWRVTFLGLMYSSFLQIRLFIFLNHHFKSKKRTWNQKSIYNFEYRFNRPGRHPTENRFGQDDQVPWNLNPMVKKILLACSFIPLTKHLTRDPEASRPNVGQCEILRWARSILIKLNTSNK